MKSTGGELLRGRGFPLGKYALRYAPEQRSILRLLADQAQELGDKPWAVFDSEHVVTFAEAHDTVWRAAAAVGASVGDGAHVGLFLRNQPEFIPALYGPMAARGVSVPLNAEARGPLLQYVIEKADTKLLIARSDLLAHLEKLDSLGAVKQIVAVGGHDLPSTVKRIPVIAWDEWLATPPRPASVSFPAFDDLCYLPFTSGTTGRQKGAMYTHHFLYLYSAMISDSLGRRRDDVVGTPLPLYHVAAVHMITNSALQAGCTAHLKSKFSASRYWEQIARDGVTYSLILGPMAAIILKTVELAPEHRMTKVFCVPPPPARRDFEQRYGVEMLWQGYGSTEVFPLPMPSEMEPDVTEDTLGHPVSWMDYGVVDEHDQLLPAGEVGEFVFRPRIPHGMVSGYYGDPAATVAAFRNFMFHTGDHGFYDTEGRLHYRGRKQDRIRVKGENVSAQELEFVALGHDAVLEAAAYGLPSEFGEEEIKLDVVLRDPVTAEELHAWLTEHLPRFMVPRYLEIVAAFPKTPTERVEKWRLRALPLDRPEVLDVGPRGAPSTR